VRSTEWLAAAAVGGRFLLRLPAFLRSPIRVAEAEAILRRRHASRAEDFLALAREAIYAQPGSPYRALLDHAGCEYGDLDRLVRREGLEDALRTLYRHGVYLTVAELKGRRPVVRGSLRRDVHPDSLRNPLSAYHVPGQTSGSRGPSSALAIDLAFVADVAADLAASLAARGATEWPLAYWDVPGGSIRPLLACAKSGHVPRRWFSLVDPWSEDLHPRYRWSAWALRWGGRAANVPLPAPEYVPLTDPLPVARWMGQALQSGATPILLTYSSPAVRLCEAARAAGIELDGARLLLYGEPVTRARLSAIRRSGADAQPLYITTETWRLGEGCLAPEVADDVHLVSDLHALIQPVAGVEQDGLPDRALLVTSLRSTAPVVLLNASLGDQAEVVERACGCPLERLGWTTHLHTIRSYEKLTAGGMTFLDADVIRVLEEVLPARFGGIPTHYQLVEGPADDGRPEVRLLVDPAVGAIDAGAVARTFLDAIGRGEGAEGIMSAVWRSAALIRVERRAPLATGAAKILHLHLPGGRRREPLAR
jgi:hypothetical protein